MDSITRLSHIYIYIYIYIYNIYIYIYIYIYMCVCVCVCECVCITNLYNLYKLNNLYAIVHVCNISKIRRYVTNQTRKRQKSYIRLSLQQSWSWKLTASETSATTAESGELDFAKDAKTFWHIVRVESYINYCLDQRQPPATLERNMSLMALVARRHWCDRAFCVAAPTLWK